MFVVEKAVGNVGSVAWAIRNQHGFDQLRNIMGLMLVLNSANSTDMLQFGGGLMWLQALFA